LLKKLGRRMRCTSTGWVISASSRWHMRCHLVVKRWLPRWCLDHLNFPSIHGRRVFQIDLWFDARVPNWPLVWCVRSFFSSLILNFYIDLAKFKISSSIIYSFTFGSFYFDYIFFKMIYEIWFFLILSLFNFLSFKSGTISFNWYLFYLRWFLKVYFFYDFIIFKFFYYQSDHYYFKLVFFSSSISQGDSTLVIFFIGFFTNFGNYPGYLESFYFLLFVRFSFFIDFFQLN
jgi:hypothetical protein